MRLSLWFRVAVLLSSVSAPLSAQVGHAPGHSPYRDIPYGHTLTGFVADIGGNGGAIGIGPHNGTAYGARFDVRVGNQVQLGLAVSRAGLERLIVDAFDSVAKRVSGPVSQSVVMAEASLQWNISGRKSWHGLAPFFGISVGVAHGSATPADTSGYTFGTKFLAAPSIGTRFFITDRLHIRLEAKEIFWRLKYPLVYALEPVLDPGTATDPHRVLTDGKLSHWTGVRALSVGIGYAVPF